MTEKRHSVGRKGRICARQKPGRTSLIYNSYDVSAEHLSAFRICYALFWLLFGGVPYLGWIASNPEILYDPPLFLSLISNQAPPALLLHIHSLLLILCFCMLLFGWFTKMAALGTSFLLLLAYSFSFSFGKIDHHIVVVLLPLIFLNSSWGDHYSIDSNRKRRRVSNKDGNRNALFNLALVLGFAYWTAGVAKVFGGWLNPDTLAVKGYYLQHLFADPDPAAFRYMLSGLDNYWLWKLMDFGAVAFEVGFLPAVLSLSFFRRYILLALVFHNLVGLFFGITFWFHLIVFLAFYPCLINKSHPAQAPPFYALFGNIKYALFFIVPALAWMFLFIWMEPKMPSALYTSPVLLISCFFTARPVFWIGAIANAFGLMLWARFVWKSRA